MKIYSKKTLLMLAVALTSAFATSCSKDDDNGGTTPVTDKTQLWPAGNADGKYGYINGNGEMVIPAQYDDADYFSCGYAVVEIGSKKYLINTEGKIQTADYDSYKDFYNNYSRVRKNNLYGFINKDLQVAVTPIYYSLGDVADNGLAYFKLSSSSDSKYGYINTEGKTVIEPQFEGAGSFVNGVAVIYNGSKYGAINRDGKFVINPTYDNLEPAYNNRIIFSVKDEKEYTYTYGLLDLDGKVIASAIYKSIRADKYQSGLFLVMDSQGKYGYIDANGNTKIACKYYSASRFQNGYATVKLESDSPEMVIDTNGNVVKTFAKNESVEEFHNGLILIENSTDRLISWVTMDGKTVYSWKH